VNRPTCIYRFNDRIIIAYDYGMYSTSLAIMDATTFELIKNIESNDFTTYCIKQINDIYYLGCNNKLIKMNVDNF
jgi:hypothetical protein